MERSSQNKEGIKRFLSYGVHLLAHLVKMGRAFFAKDAEGIIKIIQSKQGFFFNQKDIEYFWEVQSKEKC